MNREPTLRAVMTTLAALVLSVVPLPAWLASVRPAFLALAVIFWSVMAPRAMGVALGFGAGLALDVFRGAVLGQNALALSLVAYIAIREHQKIRSKPVFQQALIVLAILFANEFVIFAIDGWSGHPATSVTRWIQPVTSAILWPVVAGMLGRFGLART
jgi:rod shape-determining protein MreD